MAAMLERAGVIEELFDVIYKILGGLRGGLATATIIASTILAAMVGVIGATEVTMGIIALPAMLRRHYNPEMACGSILAGGTLGILIPPSILAILFAVVAQQSVGELFIGAVIPGLILSGMYILYVTARSYISPEFGPALPPEERVSAGEKVRLLGNVVAPISLVVLVLGVIFTGVATPVEAAGIGTFGALAVAALHRRLTWVSIEEAAITTLKASAMVLWIIFGASIFVGFYIVQRRPSNSSPTCLLGTGFGPYGILLIMMALLIILGMFLDWVGILLLAVPIFAPIMLSLSVERRVWGLPGVSAAGGRAVVVRHRLHGQHADVVLEPTVRLRVVLPEKRSATGNHHGHDFPSFGAVPDFAGGRAGADHYLSRTGPVAAAAGLRLGSNARHH